MKYIVYQHTSPSGHSYIGYTKNTLQERWAGKIKELKNATTPLAHALRKYPAKTWSHRVLFETSDKQLALDAEVTYIAMLGYYNLAKGGCGGDTGRNGDKDKRSKQSKSLAKHWAELPENEKKRRIDANVAARRANGTLGRCNPKFKEEHGMWSGYWVVNHKRYSTAKEAARLTKLNESTIIDLCVWKVDTPRIRGSKLVPKGKTPRECGFYKDNT